MACLGSGLTLRLACERKIIVWKAFFSNLIRRASTNCGQVNMIGKVNEKRKENYVTESRRGRASGVSPCRWLTLKRSIRSDHELPSAPLVGSIGGRVPTHLLGVQMHPSGSGKSSSFTSAFLALRPV